MSEPNARTGQPSAYRDNESTIIDMARRDPNALGLLYDHYVQPVYRYLASRANDPHAARVATARTFLALRGGLPNYNPQQRFAAWLFSLARAQLAGNPGAASRAGQPAGGGLPALINSLGEGEKELLRLRYTAGLSLVDTASLMQLSPETANRSLVRLLTRLLRQFEAGQGRGSALRGFEHEVRAVVRIKDAQPGFVAGLRQRLLADQSAAEISRWLAAAVSPPPASPAALSSLTWIVLFIAMALALTLGAALAIGPQRVWDELLALAGYPPQGGSLVEPVAEQRAVALPVWQDREGIRVSIEQGQASDQQVMLIYRVEGLQESQRPASQADGECRQAPALRLPDGSLLSQMSGEGSMWPTGYRSRAVFPPVPAALDEISLVLACLENTRPGAAPENWVLPLRLGSSQSGAQPVPPASSPAAPLATAPPSAGQPQPTAPAPPAVGDPAGVRLTVEQVVELEDGYLFQGSLYWQETPFNALGFDPYQLTLHDAAGNTIPLEPAEPDVSGYDPAEMRLPWAARTAGKGYPPPLTLVLPVLEGFQEVAGAAFELDLGAEPQPGQVWSIDRAVEAAGNPVHLINAELRQAEDGVFWLVFRVRVDPAQVTGLTLRDPDNHSARIGGQGGSDGQGLHTLGFSYDYRPEGRRRIEISGLSTLIDGRWTAQPVAPGGESAAQPPPDQPAACLSAANWDDLANIPPGSLPQGLGGWVLVEGPARLGARFPTVFAAELGSDRRVEIGSGSWGALAPDGMSAVYVAEDGLRLFDLQTLQDRRLEWAGLGSYHPLFDPQGDRLAYNVSGEGVTTARLDGSEMSRVPGMDASTFLAGWLPDGAGIVVVHMTAAGSRVQTVDLASGAVSEGFVIDNRQGGYALPAPDGQRIAFSESVFGQPAYGVYTANLDGSGKCLLASAGTVGLTAAAWSADGGWLLVTAQNTALDTLETLHFLIQPGACQTVHLADLGGTISDWRSSQP